MYFQSLHLENIGPFIAADIEFYPSITLITGENGTGKTIILDAIRKKFGFSPLRNIYRATHHKIQLSPDIDPLKKHIRIYNYWSSLSSVSHFRLTNLIPLDHNAYLENALSGNHQNIDVTNIICNIDYLRTSEVPDEKEAGEFLYQRLKEIFSIALLDGGKLKYVSRARFEPIIEQNGCEVTLEQLSSGNLYIVQKMIAVLGQMYSAHIVHKTPISEICHAPGFLLIDEAENHLHPKWQKRFLPSIRRMFPNLQIIATTHSPFIVSSVQDAKIYVCEVAPRSSPDVPPHCIIRDATDQYANDGKSYFDDGMIDK